MNLAALSTVLGIVGTLGGGGYVIATTLESKADKTELQVAGVRVDFIYDKMLESKYEQIITLDAKRNKSPDEIERLRYLRDEVKRIKEIRQQR